MNKLYYKLAFTNIKNSKQLYLPYLLTGILTVMMYYTMSALTNNPGLEQMPGSASLKQILTLGTSVIGIFAVIFLFYTNSFIMKRRKKELGVYNILGMEKRHISRVLFVETLFTAVVSIGGGLLLGIVFNKLMMMMLYRIVGFTSPIQFSISMSGIRNCLILFCIIYLLTYLYDRMQVKMANPVELLHGGNVGEREPKTKLLMTLIGVICIGAGYYIAITTESPIEALLLFFVAVILVIVGTYCLFTAGSIALLKMLRKNNNYYYKTKHFTAVSGMIYRMKQNAVGLANICILSTMVLVMVSTTVCMFIGLDDELDNRYPNDVSISSSYNEIVDDNGQFLEEVKNTVKNTGRTITGETVSASFQIMGMMHGDEIIYSKDKNNTYDSEMAMVVIMTRDTFQTATGIDTPQLEEGEIVLAGTPAVNGDEFKILEHSYKIKEQIDYVDEADAYVTWLLQGVYYVIVADNAASQQIFAEQKEYYGEKASSYYYNIGIDMDGTDEEKIACAATLMEMIHSFNPEQPATSRYVESRAGSEESFFSMYGGLFFLGLFLGAMFLMVTVLIIFYKQISEGYDDKERFAIMEKVGMSNAEVKATIGAQIRTVFLLPILTATVHVIAAFPMISRILSVLNLTNTTLFIYCTIGTILVFTAIYLLVFLLTSRSYYKIVGNQIRA